MNINNLKRTKMRTFRLIGMALIAMLISVNFTACSKDDDNEPTEEIGLVGTWKGQFNYGGNDYQILTLTFTADGKYTKVRKGHEDGEDYSDTFNGTYTYNENTKKIAAKFTDKNNDVSTDDYYMKSVSATTLVLIDWIAWEDGYTGSDTFTRQ